MGAMQELRAARVYAPATIGNVAAGFDVLGAALSPLDGELWGDVVAAEVDPEGNGLTLTVEGPFAAQLPRDPLENLVTTSYQLFCQALVHSEQPHPALAVTLTKNLPTASGLGSSASSIVAALIAFNAVAGSPLENDALLRLAARAEGRSCGAAHFDNVTPAFEGGLRLILPSGASRPLPFPADLAFVLVHPHFELPTAVSRAALPASVPLAETVTFGQNLATLIHALYAQDRELLRAALHDPLAEPRRAALVPGFRAAQRAALEAGALGASLSGSGPSLFAVAEEEDALDVAAAMVSAFGTAGLASQARLCTLDHRGARRLREGDRS